MPVITVEGLPIDVERKRQLVKELYKSAAEIYKTEQIVILIKENALENVGVNGELIADLREG